MSTTDELSGIAKALNDVQSAGQVRAAVGAALNALHEAYGHLDDFGLFQGDIKASSQKALDTARLALESWLPQVMGDDSVDYSNDWATHRDLVNAAYVAIAGVEGAASYEPQTSNLDILLQSIKEAPGVFGRGVGAVLNAVGQAAGKGAAGLGLGLGFGGWALVIGAVAALVLLNKAEKGLMP